MVIEKEQELKFITQDEIEEKIKNHLLILRWGNDLDDDFSWYHFTNWVSWKDTKDEKKYYINNKIFEERNLEWCIFINSVFWVWYNFSYADNLDLSFMNANADNLDFSFMNANLKNADFKNSKIKDVYFHWAILDWVDIRWAKYNTDTFSKEQLDTMILTDEDYNKYEEKKKLENENKELKKDVTEKNEVLKNTSEKQTNLLTQSFEKLEKQFLLEEKRWLVTSFIIFIFLLLFFFSIPILDIFVSKITWELKYLLLPLWVLLSTFLYFSIYQYSKSKKLRIENSNKIALLHWFSAIRADILKRYG